jgi:hypothetical protein
MLLLAGRTLHYVTYGASSELLGGGIPHCAKVSNRSNRKLKQPLVMAMIFTTKFCGVAYLFPALRNIEDELMDHDVRTPGAPGAEALAQMV